MTKMDLEPLISSLGDTSSDAFCFICAFASTDQIQERLRQEPPQGHLDLGFNAAFTTQRADVAKLLMDQGANVEPLIAFIGFAATQAFLSTGQRTLKSQHIESPPIALSSPERSLREHHNLRLQWISLKPKNRTVGAIIEGVENQQPTALHLQACCTSFSSTHRIAWMQFDLDHSAYAHLNRDANNKTIFGTPLHWVVDDHADIWENREILAFLLACGADPTIKDRFNDTPRDVCLERLRLPEGDLHPKMREFYFHAADELAKAEQKFADGTERNKSTSLLGKVMSVFSRTS